MPRDLEVLYRSGSLVGLTDHQLLERFRAGCSAGDHDLVEAALAAVVARHSSMVWNVCRSVIRDHHDVEDAFQATFLILVRKVGSLQVGETLAPWLHVVAYRTASSVRAAAARRRQAERHAGESLREAARAHSPTAVPDSEDEIRSSIHAEIRNLPEVFRAVVVLCDLEGLSYLEAAGRLGIPLGTVQSRLARARRRLRRGLERMGLRSTDAGAGGGPTGASLTGPMAVGAPASLAAQIGRLGTLVATDPRGLGTSLAGSVPSLIEGGLRSMFLGNLGRVLAGWGIVVFLGGTLWYAQAGPGQDGREAIRKVERRGTPRGEVADPVEIPAPRQLRVSSGQGKALVYDLDDKGKPLRGPAGWFREARREVRWAVLTGVLDHDRVQKAFVITQRKPLPPAERMYGRVELERRSLREDGTWSEWRAVDQKANVALLEHVPEIEMERVAPTYILPGLVDPLPFLTDGAWRDVIVEEFLPPPGDQREERPVARNPAMDLRDDRPPVVMVRTLDFTVEPGRSYRYRARVVLFNSPVDREKPGDRKLLSPADREKPGDRELIFGRWSEATGVEAIPPKSAIPIPSR